MTNGLSNKEIQVICEVLARVPEVEEAFLFGSRVLGTYRETSDIDIAVRGEQISIHSLLKLHSYFEDLSIPYKIDIVHIEELTNQELLDHIKNQGQRLFSKIQ